MNKRAFCHDYRRPGSYLITIVTEPRLPLFGRLKTGPVPYTVLSPLGLRIRRAELLRITYYYPNVEVCRYVIMPDHIHILIKINYPFANEKDSLGSVIRGFKIGCNRAYRELNGLAEHPGIFEEGYNDKWIHREGQFDAWKVYIADNPRRAVLKRQNPELFTTKYGYKIADFNCEIYGNYFLLNIPDREAVRVRSHDTDADFERKFAFWRQHCEAGGTLVSAAISKRERDVINWAKDRGAPVIELCDSGFPPLWKPAGRDFDCCAAGKLLLISPWPYVYGKPPITRRECQDLNRLAEAIAGHPAIL
ncbi:MAG: transposase [Bacteroidales bacterium]|nr:transposase [Bacteroidales bacterium]